jgi:hypothetical protein
MAKRKKGVLTDTITNVAGQSLYAGDIVYFIRKRSLKDSDGHRFTNYEWHYSSEDETILIRAIRLIIQGQPNITEEII